MTLRIPVCRTSFHCYFFLFNCLSSHTTILSYLSTTLLLASATSATLPFFFSCFLFLPFPVLPSLHVSLLLHRFRLCRASVFDGCCYREPRKLLQPLTQLQCVQHRPGHERSYYHTAVRRVLRPQERRRAHPMSVGGHQLRRGTAHTNVHSH